MKLAAAFDLDHTLYATGDLSYRIERQAAARLGITVDPALQQEHHTFAAQDWHAYARNIGIPNELVSAFLRLFDFEEQKCTPPPIIPSTPAVLDKVVQIVGKEQMYIVTNCPPSQVERRFRRDNLMHFYDRVRCAHSSKTFTLVEIALESDCPVLYVGDKPSDAHDCIAAQTYGVRTHFCGITHEYSQHADQLRIAMQQLGNCHEAKSVEELPDIVQRLLTELSTLSDARPLLHRETLGGGTA